jgi:hypothetical protein
VSLAAPVLFACTTAANALANNNSDQAIFPAANDTLTLEANTTYFFEAVIRVTNGATAHVDSFGFGGTATFTSINYDAITARFAPGAVGTTTARVWGDTAAMTAIGGSSIATGSSAQITGVIRTNAAGTIIPQWKFSANPTGTCQVEPNSYIRLQKVGADTIASSGPWA